MEAGMGSTSQPFHACQNEKEVIVERFVFVFVLLARLIVYVDGGEYEGIGWMVCVWI